MTERQGSSEAVALKRALDDLDRIRDFLAREGTPTGRLAVDRLLAALKAGAGVDEAVRALHLALQEAGPSTPSWAGPSPAGSWAGVIC
ncbi:type II toxin-antitoxin system RelE/ParE family toxin [Streptomyces sp. NPDC046853]|uniref:type II toxin-antitoxin system RelE/ParE family toxin n=1 Tax=Streptomyces sp. NPDC046853 TaxID=3154920 RepID=UPI0033D048A9